MRELLLQTSRCTYAASAYLRRNGLTCCTIAHRLSTVRHADTIHVLERGRIVESGTHDELLGARGLYYAMWRQQIGERERTGHEEGGRGDSPAVAL